MSDAPMTKEQADRIIQLLEVIAAKPVHSPYLPPSIPYGPNPYTPPYQPTPIWCGFTQPEITSGDGNE